MSLQEERTAETLRRKGFFNMKREDQYNSLPIYFAIIYPMLREVAIDFGYALSVHGSMLKDLDLIAVPWIEKPKDHIDMLIKMADVLNVRFPHGRFHWECEESLRPHGRKAYAIVPGTETGYIDISIFTPGGGII